MAHPNRRRIDLGLVGDLPAMTLPSRLFELVRVLVQIPTGARASLRGRHIDRHSMGSEDEVEQSVKRAHSGRLR